MKVMILAAGRGKRLQPLTNTIPKPLVKVAGVSLIEYHLQKLAQSGFKKIVINTAWLAHKIQQQLNDGTQFGLNITYSHEIHALESAGGIINALPLLGEKPFLVINADIWTDFDFSTLQNIQLSQQAHLVLVNNPAHNGEGDFSIENGHLSNQNKAKYTYSGIGVYQPSFFEHLKFNPNKPKALALAPLLKEKADKKQISAQHYQGKWTDVGTVERLKLLNESLA